LKRTINRPKSFYFIQLKLLNRDNTLAQRKLTLSETRVLQEALSADCKTGNIRLREGEYQYTLAKAIASFQLELHFPDVKDIIKGLYGEEKASDIQFIRKIQTILKKMERSNIVRILPKKKPWDLQRYALTSFKFQDVDKNLVAFATDYQIKQAQDMLRSISIQQEAPTAKPDKIKICVLVLIVVAFYMTSVWALMQYNPIIFVLAFSGAIAFSVILGKALSHE
jgi:hypothetical protein